MSFVEFPPIEQADHSGLLAIGGDLEIETLKLAYSQGIFPWPFSDRYPISWYSPDPRGIIEIKDLKISRSLIKLLKKNPYQIKFNTNFLSVINYCAQSKNRGPHQGTWITPQMIAAYHNFFKVGLAYSVEAYKNEELVGGVYGVCMDSFISGESMFYLQPNASKVALIYLLEKLKSLNIHWMDTQMVTPVVASLGGKEIPRAQYLKKLHDSLRNHESSHYLFQN